MLCMPRQLSCHDMSEFISWMDHCQKMGKARWNLMCITDEPDISKQNMTFYLWRISCLCSNYKFGCQELHYADQQGGCISHMSTSKWGPCLYFNRLVETKSIQNHHIPNKNKEKTPFMGNESTHTCIGIYPLYIHRWGCWWSSTVRYTVQWRNNGRDGVSNHQPYDGLLNRLFRRRSKKISKLRVTGLWAGNSPVTDEFPAQMASNVENDSIWWRHHVYRCRQGHVAAWPRKVQVWFCAVHQQAHLIVTWKAKISLQNKC